ncbi:uncharacterized protein NECHADRAFT_79481 [Fusarium vanettenii 77-13-4]|uniref:DNA2/NAM7 helicase-like C-terminal domain-containing protein n=1 Tax=Fusarium vanettenii (strain ATCC MYA-4622 / CBS 123669 / FGSC 9596 / NRRL 45880 / 77-13-4) TaxID=660122 RepID=C7YNZ8_FUSV7|nr:uncharacterized protein NECHADRAFT_79481 [Fusarium vanettenii 77-13-4]EEU46666.1 hypothetical protein NECHADRAFT_79481 [Fusarium vanettenii 77-13-4]
MFELCHAEVYSDLPFQYGPGCDISLPQHSAGRQVEIYLQMKYSDLKPADLTACLLKEQHGPESWPWPFSPTSPKANPACFVVISPYKSNVELINRLCKNPEYAALAGMAVAVTVDSFQGQGGDNAVVVMGTTGKSGPGFTADEQRLNVMFSRQKNGLLVVGDIDAAGPLGKDKKETFDANGEAISPNNEQAFRATFTYSFLTFIISLTLALGKDTVKGSREVRQNAKKLEIKSQSDVVTAAANECLQGQTQPLDSLVNRIADVPDQDFDPVRHIDLGSATVTIDNHGMARLPSAHPAAHGQRNVRALPGREIQSDGLAQAMSTT